MVTQLFLLWFLSILKWLTLFHATRKSLQKNQQTYLFITDCYRFHGVPKVLVSDKDPKIIGKVWQSFIMENLNSKMNISTARHPRTYGLTERANKTMQTLLRC